MEDVVHLLLHVAPREENIPPVGRECDSELVPGGDHVWCENLWMILGGNPGREQSSQYHSNYEKAHRGSVLLQAIVRRTSQRLDSCYARAALSMPAARRDSCRPALHDISIDRLEISPEPLDAEAPADAAMPRKCSPCIYILVIISTPLL